MSRSMTGGQLPPLNHRTSHKALHGVWARWGQLQCQLPLVLMILFMCGTDLSAQFLPGVEVTPPGVQLVDVVLEADKSCPDCIPAYVTLTAHNNENIFFGGSLLGFAPMVPVVTGFPGVGHVDHKQGALAGMHLLYDAPLPGGQSAIFLSQSVAAGFNDPVLYSSGANPATQPKVSVLQDGNCLATWIEDTPVGPQVILRVSSFAPVLAGNGSSSEVASLNDGVGVLFWSEGSLLRFRFLDSFSFGAEQLLYDFQFVPDEWKVSVLPDGTVHVVAFEGTTLHTITGDLNLVSVTSEASLRSPGGIISDLNIDTISEDKWVAAWLQDQQVHVCTKENGLLTTSEIEENPSGIPESVSISLDAWGITHLAVSHSNGSVHYRHNTPLPEAIFSLSTEDDGVADHEIFFESYSEGLILEYLWDFGDGSTSTESSGSHTYLEPGQFWVSLQVTGPGGVDIHQQPVPVTVTAPENYMKFEDIAVFGGQPVIHPVLGTHTDPLQGYQIGVKYDSTYIQMTEISIYGTQAAQLNPEFIISNIFDDAENSDLYLAVIFDTLPPFDGRTVDPGINHTLCTLNYSVEMGHPLGSSTELRFANGIGFPPINTIYAIEGGLALEPYFINGTVLISEQPQFLFIRGDATYDQSVNIADAIFMLDYLFVGGEPSVCPDAADTNDDGILNIGDAIYSLSYLFSAGETIPYPYPGYGLDPSEDDLDPCLP